MTTPDARRTSWLARMPVWLMVVVMSTALFAAATYAATRPQNGRPAPPPPVASSGSNPSPTPSRYHLPTASPSPAPEKPELTAAVSAIEKKHDVQLGVAIAPLAPVGQQTVAAFEAGTVNTGKAWATLDVAIALAVMREPKQPEDLDYLLNRALIEGSTAADEALWSFLGDPEDAAEKTRAILQEAGDNATVVRSTSPDPDVQPYAQTLWSNRAQAQFGAAIYCMDGTWSVMNRMDDQPAEARWGLGRLARTQYKSGSGTQPNGTLLVRQFGAATLANGDRVGIGISAVASADAEQQAKDAISELADTIYNQATGFGGSCNAAPLGGG